MSRPKTDLPIARHWVNATWPAWPPMDPSGRQENITFYELLENFDENIRLNPCFDGEDVANDLYKLYIAPGVENQVC